MIILCSFTNFTLLNMNDDTPKQPTIYFQAAPPPRSLNHLIDSYHPIHHV